MTLVNFAILVVCRVHIMAEHARSNAHCGRGVQAEAVGQLVEARTGAAADAALAGLTGGLASTIAAVRAAIIEVRTSHL